MARKHCPACRYMTAASAGSCPQCGHVFAAGSVAALVPSGRPQRCAMCGIVSPASVARCQCGFEFDGEPGELRELYVRRRRAGLAMIVGSSVAGVVAMTALGALLFFGPVTLLGFGGVGSMWVATARKGLRIARAAGDNLAELDGKTEALPPARVITGGSGDGR